MLYFLLTNSRILRFYLLSSQGDEIGITVMFLGQPVVFTILVRTVFAVVS